MPTAVQRQLFGTQVEVTSSFTADVASGAFSGSLGVFDNSADGTVPNAPMALATLELPDFGGAPTLGESIELWGVRQDTVSTAADTGDPGGNDANSAEFFQTFPVEDVDALQRISRPIVLEGVGKVKFFIRNVTSQNLNNDGGTPLKLFIKPYSYAMVS